jgi:hypothetical protein
MTFVDVVASVVVIVAVSLPVPVHEVQIASVSNVTDVDVPLVVHEVQTPSAPELVRV